MKYKQVFVCWFGGKLGLCSPLHQGKFYQICQLVFIYPPARGRMGLCLGGPVSRDRERVDPAGEGDRDRRARRLAKFPLYNEKNQLIEHSNILVGTGYAGPDPAW